MRAKMIACCSESKTKIWMLARFAMSLDGNPVRLLRWKKEGKKYLKKVTARSIWRVMQSPRTTVMSRKKAPDFLFFLFLVNTMSSYFSTGHSCMLKCIALIIIAYLTKMKLPLILSTLHYTNFKML